LKEIKKIKIAFFGASGIGKFHVRNFSKLNVSIDSILSSSKFPVNSTTRALKDSLGLDIKSFNNIDLLLSQSSPDAVVIATPNELHFDQILKVLDKKIPIFCEKPMFWNKQYTYNVFLKKLDTLTSHPNRAIFVNTSSANYIECIREYLPPRKDIESFNFNFITHGNKKYLEIAEDLLPHGFAMLIELLGFHKITSFKHNFSENTYKCNFSYSGCSISFKFKEGATLQKKFFFTVNKQKFKRIQIEGFNNYQVFLDCISDNKKIKMLDPFEEYALRFLNFCKDETKFKSDGFAVASHNLDLMAKILLK
jgi:hypothetical protein